MRNSTRPNQVPKKRALLVMAGFLESTKRADSKPSTHLKFTLPGKALVPVLSLRPPRDLEALRATKSEKERLLYMQALQHSELVLCCKCACQFLAAPAKYNDHLPILEHILPAWSRFLTKNWSGVSAALKGIGNKIWTNWDCTESR